MHLQVSLRSDANARALTKFSFKHSINTYWVTSAESPDALWSEELPASDETVQKFRARAHDGDVGNAFFTFADTYEHFLGQWEAKVRRTLNDLLSPALDPCSVLTPCRCAFCCLRVASAQVHSVECVGDKRSAGAAYPQKESELLRELWQWTRTECPAYQRFMSSRGEELDDGQCLDGFGAHAEGEDATTDQMAEVMEVGGDRLEEALAGDDASDVEEQGADGTGEDEAAAAEAAAVTAGVDMPRVRAAYLAHPSHECDTDVRDYVLTSVCSRCMMRQIFMLPLYVCSD